MAVDSIRPGFHVVGSSQRPCTVAGHAGCRWCLLALVLIGASSSRAKLPDCLVGAFPRRLDKGRSMRQSAERQKQMLPVGNCSTGLLRGVFFYKKDIGEKKKLLLEVDSR